MSKDFENKMEETIACDNRQPLYKHTNKKKTIVLLLRDFNKSCTEDILQ